MNIQPYSVLVNTLACRLSHSVLPPPFSCS